MKKTLLLFTFCIFLSCKLVAQQQINIDSLRRVYNQLEKNKPSFANDTNKVILLQEIWAYNSMYTDSGLIYSNKILQMSQKIKWKKGMAYGYILISSSYLNNDPAKSLDAGQKALAIGLELNDKKIIGDSYSNIGNIYHFKQNYSLSKKYYELSNQYYKKENGLFEVANNYNFIAVCWLELHNKKNALKYFQLQLDYARKYKSPINKLELTEAFALSNMSDVLIDSVGHKDEAIKMLKESNRLFTKLKRPMYLAEGEASIGQAYMKDREYKKALPYLIIGWNAYQKYNWTRGIDEDNLDKNLYETYKYLNQPAKSLFHLERYYVLLDSALKSELKTQRDIVKVQEDKEKQQAQIAKMKANEIVQSQKFQKRTNNFLWAGLALLSIFGAGLLWYNRRLSAKNKDLAEKNEIINEVTHKIQATEITALRAQMNPHFIFNCLNSIQLFTAQNNVAKATEYLTKFSRLIRLVLENSRSEKVSLENELETLKLYIELEAMRFREKFTYEINVEPNVDLNYIEIPPLLLQPFVENAIWHGLMHKEEGGKISVNLSQPADNMLHVEILDDGVGREKAAEYKSKSATKNKSFGMKVTTERIELINQLYKTNTKVKVIDLKNNLGDAIGTKVILEIPF